MTTIVTTTAIPRQGAGGMGRSNSRGGPPWICSSREGLRKNKRGSRRRSLKLEIDERITASLSDNDGTYHSGPARRDHPRRQTHHCRLKRVVAHRPMHRDHTGGDGSNLQQFTRGKNRIAVWMLAKHPAEHSARDREIGRAKKHPRNANCRVSGETGEDA